MAKNPDFPRAAPRSDDELAVIGRILMAAWPHLSSAEFRLLAFLLSLGPPGTVISMTDRELSERAGYIGRHSARWPLRSLLAGTIPGSTLTWIGGTAAAGRGREIWVNTPPPGTEAAGDGSPHRPRRGPDRAERRGRREEGGGR